MISCQTNFSSSPLSDRRVMIRSKIKTLARVGVISQNLCGNITSTNRVIRTYSLKSVAFSKFWFWKIFIIHYHIFQKYPKIVTKFPGSFPGDLPGTPGKKVKTFVERLFIRKK